MKSENQKIEYFLYARKSSESEDRQAQSIPDQVQRLKQFAKENKLTIKKVFTESKSAKKPNARPIFKEMMDEIEQGKANGLLCWQINRLSRNPPESGLLQWLLQEGALQAIQTIDRVFRPQDNALIFSVESGTSNQFILDLRKNTLRGMRSRIEKGWAPILAPIGYLNHVTKNGEHIIIKDPDKFDLVRKIWDLMLTGNYSVQQVLDIATNDWGFRTKQYKRRGGGEFTQSGIYRMFCNLFYTGLFVLKGQRYEGSHDHMITMDEFECVQKLLGRTSNSRFQKHEFPFTGVIHCGDCGCLVTAESHTKLVKSKGVVKTYTHYHCTLKKKNYQCSQKEFTSEADLEIQIEQEIAKITILPQFRDWALEIIRDSNNQEIEDRTKIYEIQHKTLEQTQKQLDNLTRMRYQELIDDETFVSEKNILQNKILDLKQRVKETESRADQWIELTERAFTFAAYAHKAFMDGGPEVRKEILMALGSNQQLINKKFSVLPNKWYRRIENGYAGLEKEFARLEPNKTPVITGAKQYNKTKTKLWGG